MTRFDQAMAASAAGEPRDLRTLGDLYCTLTLAAELTLEADRFEQWNRRVFGYLQRYRHPDVLTFCGTCCAQVLVAGGDLAEGERWLTDTLASLEASGQQARCVHPATRLASLRVEQGRLEEAEELLRGSEDLPEAVQPMVTLYLARRQTALAAARLHRRLNQLGPGLATRRAAPRPAGGRPARAGRPRGRIGHRRRAGRRGHPVGSERFGAASDLALGSVAAAGGEVPEATRRLDRAIELFTRHHMPQQAAAAHLALARGVAAPDPERAVAEARQALEAFERIGADLRRRHRGRVPAGARCRRSHGAEARRRAQPPRGRGAPPPRLRPDERRDRRAAVHQHEDGRDARGQHLRQAPRPEPGGRRPRSRSGTWPTTAPRPELEAPSRRESVILPILPPPVPPILALWSPTNGRWGAWRKRRTEPSGVAPARSGCGGGRRPRRRPCTRCWRTCARTWRGAASGSRRGSGC